MTPKRRILLSSVYKPYAVEDSRFDDTTMLMEVLHNQVTRGQELFSFRIFHPNLGLHVIARNLDADTTVLDFPSLTRFVRHLSAGPWDYVGLSFIIQNLEKVKVMCRLVRIYAPEAQIVLGGFGAALEGLKDEVDADHICRGEGTVFMRRLLGQDETAPLVMPEVNQQIEAKVMGVPLRRVPAGGLPVTLGCPNRCDFCVTAHFYDRGCIRLIRTGTELYHTMERMSPTLGTRNFILFDENFLATEDIAWEYLDVCRRRGRQFLLQIFASADRVARFTPLELVEMGVDFLWIGIEGKHAKYPKNRGVDFRKLIDGLQEHGISVLLSGILFFDEHSPENIDDEIGHICSHPADFIQFMQYGPIPHTSLYKRMEKEGRILHNKPLIEWTGQGNLWYQHPHFLPSEGKAIIDGAFRREYMTLGPSILRQARTKLRGYRTLKPLADRNPLVAEYLRWLERVTSVFYPMLWPIERHLPTEALKQQARSLREEYRSEFGPLSIRGMAKRAAAEILSSVEKQRLAWLGDRRVPKTIVTRYASN